MEAPAAAATTSGFLSTNARRSFRRSHRNSAISATLAMVIAKSVAFWMRGRLRAIIDVKNDPTATAASTRTTIDPARPTGNMLRRKYSASAVTPAKYAKPSPFQAIP